MSADFRGKEALPTNHCWCQKTRVIAVLCGIKIFAVRCLVLSQYTHLMDRQTDRQTEFRQQYRALHYVQSHGKNATQNAQTLAILSSKIKINNLRRGTAYPRLLPLGMRTLPSETPNHSAPLAPRPQLH